MENRCRFICQFCVLQFVFWSANATYYVKPTGGYEISEMPLPSSVIEQINKSNSPLTPTGASMHIAGTVHAPSSQNPARCPKPSICPCPCPQRSQGGQATSQRPLPMNGSSPQQCPSVCVCLCLSAVLPQVIPPNPVLPPGPSGNATRPASIVLRPSQTSTSPTPFKQSPGTLVPCSSSGTVATPTISSTPGSTCYSTQQQSTSSITCPPVTTAAAAPTSPTTQTSPSLPAKAPALCGFLKINNRV